MAIPRVMERQMIPIVVWRTTACLLRDSLRRASRGETLSALLYYASLSSCNRTRITSERARLRSRPGNENTKCIVRGGNEIDLCSSWRKVAWHKRTGKYRDRLALTVKGYREGTNRPSVSKFVNS